MKKLSLTIVFLFLALLLAGQDCSYEIRGIVKGVDGISLPGATIFIPSLEKGEVTDVNGAFQFLSLCRGHHELSISYTGYEKAVVVVEVPLNKPVSIVLKPSETILQNVIVEGNQAARNTAQAVDILTSEDLELLHGKPLGEALKRISGVNAIQTGPAIFKPVIHGLHSQRILILNNGIRQEGQQWGVEHAPEIDPFIASTIEVVKGAEAVRYGSDAVGGVIIISAPSLHATKAIGGEVNLGFMSNSRRGVFSGMWEGPFKSNGPWNWRLQSSAKRGGDFSAPHYNLSNTGVKEFNFSGAAGFKNAEKGMEVYVSSFNAVLGILRAAHIGNLDDFQNSIESSTPWYVNDFTYQINNPRQELHHHLLKFSAYKFLTKTDKITVLYGSQINQRKEFDIRRGGRSATPSLSLNLFSNVLDVSLDHETEKHSGSIGVNATFKNNHNQPGTGVRPLLPDYDQFSGGIFLIEKVKRNNWVLEAGVRYDHQYLRVLAFAADNTLQKPMFRFNYISGSAGLSYDFGDGLKWISNIGISSRPPHVSELYSEGLHHSNASLEYGLFRKGDTLLRDPSLIKMEISHKWINTFHFNKKNFSLEISGYYNSIRNYVYLRPNGTRLTIRGYFPVFEYEQTTANLLGCDLNVIVNLGQRIKYAGKATYLYAQDKLRNAPLIFMPPPQVDSDITYSIPKLGKASEFFVTLGVPVTFEQQRAPMAVYPKDIEPSSTSMIYDFAPAPKGYMLVNLSTGCKFPLAGHTLSFSFSIENITNESYRNYLNRLRYYSDEAGRNFILRLKYNFASHE